MDFFEKLKEAIYAYKVNLFVGGILICFILLGNVVIYCLLTDKIDNISNSKEDFYASETTSEKVDVLETNYYKVDIKGAVINPGVYELKEKSRVIDVINMAGGLTELSDTSITNLSKYITDEMVIVIYTKEEVANFNVVLEEEKEQEKDCIIYNEVVQNDSCKESIEEDSVLEDNNEGTELDTKVSINKADINLLMTLPGIGESKAKSIIDYREITPFIVIEDIMNVSGIGEKLFEEIKEYIQV